MIITLKDGSKKEYAQAMSIIDIARDISEGLARVACVGEVDGQTEDLRTVIDKDLSLIHICNQNLCRGDRRSKLPVRNKRWRAGNSEV